MKPGRLPLWIVLCAAFGAAHGFVNFESSKTYLRNNIQLSGAAGMTGEAYHTDGPSNYRPAASGRLTFSPSLSILNLVTLSADVMLSTEGSYNRQSMNILGLHPTWKWGRAHLGDYSESFSKYSFNGTNVKGIELDLFPGLWRFTAGGGQTRRAVEGDATNQSFSQYLYAGRLGYGSPNGNYIDLIGLHLRDDETSLEHPLEEEGRVNPDTLETDLDTVWLKPPDNPYAVTPQENLVAGFAGQLCLLGKRVVLNLEMCGSAFTKDLYAEAADLDSVDLPGFVSKPLSYVFTPRQGSSLDMALSSSVQWNTPRVRTQAGYNYVGPGYVSLGAGSVLNDRRELQFSTAVSLGKSRVQASWTRMTDNLLGQKLSTNVRNQIGTSFGTSFRQWYSQYGLNAMLMSNDASSDSLAWDYTNLTLTTAQGLRFKPDKRVRQVGLQYTYQTSEKALFNRTDLSSYHTASLNSGRRIRDNMSLSGSAGLSFRSTEAKGSYLTQVYSAGLSHAAFKNRLCSSLSAASSMVRDTRVFRAGLTANYFLTRRAQLTSDVSYNYISGKETYAEQRASLSLSHSL